MVHSVIKDKKLEKNLIWVGWVAFACSIFASNLGGLAGFNLNSSLAMADRFLEAGKLFYSQGAIDNYAYSQIYFPGFSILAIPFAYLFSGYAVDALHVLSSILILLFLGLLVIKATKFGVDFNLAAVVVPLTVVSFMPAILWYAADFKPDIFLISIYFICSSIIDSKNRLLQKSIALFLFSLLGMLIKQQFVGLWLGQIIVVLIWKRHAERVFLFISGLIGLVVAIAVLASIDGLYFHAIKSVTHHNVSNLINLGSIIYRSIIQCWPVLIGLVFYFYTCLNAHIENSEKKYLVVCATWILIRAPNFLMEGSTEENFYTALIIFLPLSLVGYARLFRLGGAQKKLFIVSMASVFILISSLSFAKNSIESVGRYLLKKDIVSYILNTHPGENIIFDENAYSIVRELPRSIKTSTLVVNTYNMMGEDISDFIENFKSGGYPIFISSSRSGYDPLVNWMDAEKYFTLEKVFSYKGEKYFIYHYVGLKNK